MTGSEPLLVAEDLHRSYRRRGSPGGRSSIVNAVAGVNLSLAPGATLGIVGGSGAGKSTLARLLLALERPDRGVVRFEGRAISALAESRVRPLRRHFQAVFQDPGLSLDPCLRIDAIIAEPLAAHAIGNSAARRARVVDLLDQVGLPAAAARRLPDAFSGGERQRIAIARALAPEPRLLILDEPVSSLDVSIQAQILDLMADLRRRLGLALILISHDLEVVREVCQDVAIMHQGRFVESGRASEVLGFAESRHTGALHGSPRQLKTSNH